MAHVEKYKIFQKELVSTKDGNPFKDITIKISFINENEKIETEGFYKGKIPICLGGKQYMAVCMKEI